MINMFKGSSKSLNGEDTSKRPPLFGSTSMTSVQSAESSDETDATTTPSRRRSSDSVVSASSATSTDSATKKSFFGSIFGSDTPEDKERKAREKREKKERKEKEKADAERKKAESKSSYRKTSEFSTEVHLSSPLKLTQANRSVIVVTMVLTATSDGRFLEIKRGDALFAKVRVECTTSAMETTFGAFSFQIATYGKVINLNAASDPAVLAWVNLIHQTIRDCDPYPAYPADPIYKEALIRQQGETYTVKVVEKKPLNVAFDKAMEWVRVSKGNPELDIETGSILVSVNGMLTWHSDDMHSRER